MWQPERQGFTVVTPVDRDRLPELRRLLAEIQRDPAGNPHVPLARVPTHFATFVVLDREVDSKAGYPPLLVLDVAHDGARRAYLDALVAAAPGLRSIYRHAVGYPGDDADAAAFARWLRGRI